MAKKAAHDILVKANVKKELNIGPITRKLKDVANVVLKQLEKETKNNTTKPNFKDYIAILNNYIIPILGKYNVAFPRFGRHLILSTMNQVTSPKKTYLTKKLILISIYKN